MKSTINHKLLSTRHPANDDPMALHLQFSYDNMLLETPSLKEYWALMSMLYNFMTTLGMSLNSNKI